MGDDLERQWLQSYSCKRKLLRLPRKNFAVRGADVETKSHLYWHFLDLDKSCEELSWSHCTSYRSETKGIVERAIRRVKAKIQSRIIIMMNTNWKYHHQMFFAIPPWSRNIFFRSQKMISSCVESETSFRKWFSFVQNLLDKLMNAEEDTSFLRIVITKEIFLWININVENIIWRSSLLSVFLPTDFPPPLYGSAIWIRDARQTDAFLFIVKDMK